MCVCGGGGWGGWMLYDQQGQTKGWAARLQSTVLRCGQHVRLESPCIMVHDGCSCRLSPLGNLLQPLRAEGALCVDVQRLAFCAAHING
jgi:hypothetical protein